MQLEKISISYAGCWMHTDVEFKGRSSGNFLQKKEGGGRVQPHTRGNLYWQNIYKLVAISINCTCTETLKTLQA